MWQTQLRTRQPRRLRRTMSVAEKRLWEMLRDRRLDGLKFRRQVPVAGGIADFACLEARLVVEPDGGVHRLREAEDAARDASTAAAGIVVMRVSNESFLNDPDPLLAGVRAHVRAVRVRRRSPHPACSASHLLPRREKGS